MTPLLLALVLAAESPPPEVTTTPARLQHTELAAGVGLLGTGYSANGVRFGDLHLAPEVTGRLLLGGFTTEAGLLFVSPLDRDTTAPALTAGLAVGWTGERWSLTVGALMQWTSLARPALQWLPQLRASVSFGMLGISLGVFDHLGLVPAHLSADLRLGRTKLSLGWVAVLGLLASADLPLPGAFGLRASAFVFKLGPAEYALLTIGGTFDGGGR